MEGCRIRRLLRTAGPLLLAAAIAASGCASAPRTDPFLLHPMPTGNEGYSLAAGAIIYRDRVLEAEVRPLDPRYLGESLSIAGLENPFSASGGSPLPLIIFEIRLKNLGPESLYFNPLTARGTDERGNPYLPLSFTDFYLLHREDPKREARLLTLNLLCFERPMELQPGREVKRYLPLAATRNMPGTVALILPLLYGGRQSFNLSFLFEAFPAAES